MKVAVLPMGYRAGVTCTAMLTAMGLAFKQGKTTRVCFTGDNPAIKRYIGINPDDVDVTRSISQVSKLLQAHAISPDELSNYSIRVDTNLELLDSYSPALTDEETNEILSFVYSRSKTDYTICDLAYSWDDPMSEAVLKASDVIMFVCEPDWSSLSRVTEFKEKNKKLWDNTNPLLVINKYDAAIRPLKAMAKEAGMKMRSTCKIHYSPYIARSCWAQDLKSCAISSYEHDPRVIELSTDVKEITQFLLSLNQEKNKWED